MSTFFIQNLEYLQNVLQGFVGKPWACYTQAGSPLYPWKDGCVLGCNRQLTPMHMHKTYRLYHWRTPLKYMQKPSNQDQILCMIQLQFGLWLFQVSSWWQDSGELVVAGCRRVPHWEGPWWAGRAGSGRRGFPYLLSCLDFPHCT